MYSKPDSTWSIAIQFHEAISPIGNGGDSSLCCLNRVPKADDLPTTTAQLSTVFYRYDERVRRGETYRTAMERGKRYPVAASLFFSRKQLLERTFRANTAQQLF